MHKTAILNLKKVNVKSHCKKKKIYGGIQDKSVAFIV